MLYLQIILHYVIFVNILILINIFVTGYFIKYINQN